MTGPDINEYSVIPQNDIEAQRKNEETTKLNLITPVILERWHDVNNIIMEYYITKGAVEIKEDNSASRGKPQKLDYLLFYKDNIPLALVEAKGSDHSADEGYPQAVEYANKLDVPFAYATNGTELIERDMLKGTNKSMKLSDFPYVEKLWERFIQESSITPDVENIYTYPYYITATGKRPRYYQRIAINRAVKAIAEGKKRLLLVLATGTGKTFLAFQIIWRFWKAGIKKKVLYLADRNNLIDQTMRKDFKPFMDAMERIDNRHINTAKEIFLGIYQQLQTQTEDYYKLLPPDFFDIIVVDECHRGSSDVDSNWHAILDYFSPAVQIGLTATPNDAGIDEAYIEEDNARNDLEEAKRIGKQANIDKARASLEKAVNKRIEAEHKCNAVYFGNPLYVYSLKQGIEDGFLAPYKVISIETDIDKNGYDPLPGTTDVNGQPVEIRHYVREEFDRKIVVVERRKIVAKRISDFLKVNDMRYAKTIVFCEDIPHCQEMVRLLENENKDLVAKDHRYIQQITGDNPIGKAQLDNFTEPSSRYPVIAVTSKLMSTGVDAETCKVIVLDRTIGSMTEFKQIIGRGTRIKEEYEVDGVPCSKMFFTILDFRQNYHKFNDPKFDGDPVTVTIIGPQDPITPPPKTPPKPYTPPIPHKPVRVQGIDVTIVNEEVRYIDKEGKFVKQNLDACVRNNVLSSFPTIEKFKHSWQGTRDKVGLVRELLLTNDYGKKYKEKYGYAVDEYDIILNIAYDVEPPLSKVMRSQYQMVLTILKSLTESQRTITLMLLEAYVQDNFDNLRDINNIFNQPQFIDLGYTPLKVIKDCFGTKENYLDLLNRIEDALYSE